MKYMKIRTFVASALLLAAVPFQSCSDLDEVKEQVKDIQDRVEKLESKVNDANKGVDAIWTLLNSLEKKYCVVDYQVTADGCTVTFSDGRSVTIRSGEDGKDGENGGDGHTPVMGVKLVDGVYCWTVDGVLLKDAEGKNVPCSGAAPVIGVKEDGGVSYWTVNGEFMTDAQGNRVQASAKDGDNGDSFFKSVTSDGSSVVFTLADGTSFTLPMKKAASIRIEANKLHFSSYQTRTVHIGLENIIGASVSEKPEGWRVRLEGCALTITAPDFSDYNAEEDGYVGVIATSGDQTFIGRVYVTGEAPVFDMSVRPDGLMTLTELDYDFNSPGFWASFVEADKFDAPAIVAPAKAYSPQASGPDFYTWWSSGFTGVKTFDVAIDTCVINPVAGRRYAAYCFPGCYSKYVTTDPDPRDVFVKYFTYYETSFEVSNITTINADIRLSVTGCSSYYAGFFRYDSDEDLQYVPELALADALDPVGGLGGGMHGTMVSGSYSGKMSGFANLDDGAGSKNEWNFIAGSKYALAIVPKDSERILREYSTDDVIIKTIELAAGKEGGNAKVAITAGEATTSSVTASFAANADTDFYYFVLARKADVQNSGLSLQDYALLNGTFWSRRSDFSKNGVNDASLTLLDNDEECLAIAVAFDADGNCNLSSLELKPQEVTLSNGTLSVTGVELQGNKVVVSFSHSGIAKIRYINVLKSIFEEDNEWLGQDENVYRTLTTGQMWDYETIDAVSSEEVYVGSGLDYVFFAVGVDAENRFTTLVKSEYNTTVQGGGDESGYVAKTDPDWVQYAVGSVELSPKSFNNYHYYSINFSYTNPAATYTLAFVSKEDYDAAASISARCEMVKDSAASLWSSIDGKDYAEATYTANCMKSASQVGTLAYLAVMWETQDARYEPWIVGTSDASTNPAVFTYAE